MTCSALKLLVAGTVLAGLSAVAPSTVACDLHSRVGNAASGLHEMLAGDDKQRLDMGSVFVEIERPSARERGLDIRPQPPKEDLDTARPDRH